MALDRREFLAASAVALGLPSVRGSLKRVSRERPLQEWPSLQGRLVINGLGGISNPNLRYAGDLSGLSGPIPGAESDALDERAVQDALASGLSASNVTMGYVAGPMDPFEHSVADVARWDRMVREHPALTKVWSAADIASANQDDKLGIIFGFQNSAMVGDRADRIDVFANMGVKIFQLTYNVRNQVGDGSMVPENRGLSAFGLDVLERLHDRRILVDLSHSGERTCLNAIDQSPGPIAITHTGCRALADLPRNKTDNELRRLADKGGVVGIYFMPFLSTSGQPTAIDVVSHIEHAINVCGEDHVGIGTDGGTTQVDDMERYREVIRAEVLERAAAGIGAAGESTDVIPMIADLQGPTQFQKLAGLLRAKGHSWTRVEKVLGGNFFRLMEAVW